MSLKVAHAGLAGIVVNDFHHGIFHEGNFILLETMRLELTGNQVPSGNLQLFERRIPIDLDDFHAVSQRTGYGVQLIGRSDEDDFAEIKVNIQVMITKGAVLRRVQHLQAARCWGLRASPADFVDFVEHKHRVAGARPLDGLDNSSGHRSDVSATMAANFGLIPDASQAHAGKFRPRARATLRPRLVLPTPGGPAKHKMTPRAVLSSASFWHLHDPSPDA
jgi:hypothetical protein